MTTEQLRQIADTLMAARIDIGRLVDVARYNLTGETNTGDIINQPRPLSLIHEQGIAESEAVANRCRDAWIVIDLEVRKRGERLNSETRESDLQT